MDCTFMDECINEVSHEWVQYKVSLSVLWMQLTLLSLSLSSHHQQRGVYQGLPVSLQSHKGKKTFT